MMVLVSISGSWSIGSLEYENKPNTTTATKQSAVNIGLLTELSYKLMVNTCVLFYLFTVTSQSSDSLDCPAVTTIAPFSTPDISS